MAEALKKPQIITLETKGLDYTPYDVKWIPCSARFVVLGQHARGTGALNIYELEQGKAVLVKQTERKHAIKCGTFGASTLQQRHLATGDFEGNLTVYDLERPEVPVFSVKAHDSIINCIDGCGGVGVHTGPPEIVTGSRDGTVKVWDVRQKDKPVAVISPAEGEPKRDVWTVAFGNSYNDEERVLGAGYENGDVKLFDLKTMSLLWETNTKNGVCSLEFDRKDIQMNKLVVTSVESSFQLFDMRTQHPTHGFTSLSQKNRDNTTIWTVRHLPQNRDIFITSSGSGSLNVYKYNYPASRVAQDPTDKKNIGVVGSVELLNNATLAEQPISAFDWSPDKPGLCVFTAFDQQVRVAIVTKLA
ncbi:WD repeat-containing protein 92 [Rhizoclosmatium sp. JEL0117]|nr:WD repeat-containing protein 92 [Rhizoclosmatium sp. JEL0117]